MESSASDDLSGFTLAAERTVAPLAKERSADKMCRCALDIVKKISRSLGKL
jgi:hypothetical protein